MINAINPLQAAGIGSEPSLLGSGENMGKEEFLQLLVAQLRHQDPLNPMEAQEFASQLAEFSGLEQQIKTNELLEAQVGVQANLVEGLQTSAAVSTIGHTVLAVGDTIDAVGDGTDMLTLDLAEDAEVTIRLEDADGNVVHTIDAGELTAGRQQIALDAVAEGTYTVSVDATGEEGSVTATTYTSGRVEGVRWGPTGLVFVINGREVPFSSILEITN